MDRERFAELRRKAAERAEEELRQEEEIRDLLNAWDEEREGLAALRADGLVEEPEPVDLENGAEVEKRSEHRAAAVEALELPERPGDGPPHELARALGEWLERHPGDHPERKPPGEFAMQLSWLAGTLWAYDLVEGAKPDPLDVAAALGELGRTCIEEAA